MRHDEKQEAGAIFSCQMKKSCTQKEHRSHRSLDNQSVNIGNMRRTYIDTTKQQHMQHLSSALLLFCARKATSVRPLSVNTVTPWPRFAAHMYDRFPGVGSPPTSLENTAKNNNNKLACWTTCQVRTSHFALLKVIRPLPRKPCTVKNYKIWNTFRMTSSFGAM